MKNLLLYACCLLAAVPALSYEVTSFSTPSSPVFVKTQDGSADLTYPVQSEDTFGSPEWYEEVEEIGMPIMWKLYADGMFASNRYIGAWMPDYTHVFTYFPKKTWPEGCGSKWFIEYDLNDFANEGPSEMGDVLAYTARFPDQDPDADLWMLSSPYPDNIVKQNDINGPGTIEMVVQYRLKGTNNNYVTRCATLFPRPHSNPLVEEVYPSYQPVEIWLPKFHRLTPASRSALMAAYEAYFERMYYGSKGVTDDGEDEDEWTLWQLGSPDADADFIFRAPPFWNTNDQHSAKLLDGFYYPGSAYSDTNSSPSARRHYPSWCFRLMDEATNVAKLAYSMRRLSPFAVQSGWLGHGAIPDEMLRNETPFLSRPQWLLDGRTVPGHCTAENCEYSYLWWSSQVEPPAAEQKLDPAHSDETYVPEFSVFPEISSPQYYAEDGETDVYIPYKTSEDLVKNVKPAQYAFTFSMLEGDDVFIHYFFGGYPVPKLFSMIYDAMDTGCSTHWDFSGAVSYMDGYHADGLTVPGFVTNCVRQAARSLPLRSDAMAAYSVRLAETSETFRVDSGPVAAASHLLGLMDRTIHIPFQEFVCTNWTVEGISGGNYVGRLSDGESTNVIELTDIAHSESLYEWGFIPSGRPTSFAVKNTRSNATERCVDHYELKATDTSIRMFAREPSGIPEPGDLIRMGMYEENLPYKSFKVGTVVVGAEDGDWVVGGPVRWKEPPEYPTIGSGPYVMLYPKDESKLQTQTFVFTHYPSNYVPRITLVRRPYYDSIELSRGYMFCDKDSVETGMTLGPVQAGVDPDKGDASHYAGILLGGAVDSTDEHGAARSYDFISAFKTDVTSRSGLLSWIDGKVGDLSTTLSDRIKDAARCGLRDPRKPGEYAPMPEWYEQKATVVGDELEDHVLVLKVDTETLRTTKTEVFPDGTADKYVFDVETLHEDVGFVDFMCATQRYVNVRYEISEYGSYGGYGEWTDEQPPVTNSVTEETTGGYFYGPVFVSSNVVHRSATSEVVRVVLQGEDIIPDERHVASNLTFTTAYEGEELQNIYYHIKRYSRWTGGWYEVDDFTRSDSKTVPLPIPPDVVIVGDPGHIEQVELKPADAKSHEVIQVGGAYTYSPVLSISNGKIERISFESSDPNAPTIPDADEFIVANETVDGDVLNNWVKSWFEFSAVTNNTPTNAVWHGSFDGAARPAVMTWTDWTWNALKRD